MQELARQLEQVRRRGRALLIGQRLMQAAAVGLAVLMGLGLVDFGLRLPGWLRGLIGLALLAWGGWWLVRKLAAAWRFWPTLSALALRVERMYPRLGGLLSSALDFALHPQKVAEPATTAALASASVEQAKRELAGVRVARLIDLRPTRQRVMGLVGVAAVVLGLVAASPTYSAIGASRWLMPWGEAAWPKRTQIQASSLDQVWPVDTPLELTAQVGRGFKPGMRVWVNTQLVDPADPGSASAVQTQLMTEQLVVDHAEGESSSEHDGTFKLQWRPSAEVVRRVSSGVVDRQRLRVWFSAGDDQTSPQTLDLIARPALVSAVASVTPPVYASGLVAEQQVALHEQTQRIAAVNMLAGSRVNLELKLNKPLPAQTLRPEVLVPGLASLDTLEITPLNAEQPDAVSISFVVKQSVETTVMLVDEHGLAGANERLIRFEAVEDRPPTVSLIEPSADASVLATAILPVVSRAGDDVGVRRLVIDAEHPAANRALDGEELAKATTPLSQREARKPELTADAVLDLSRFSLAVGDVVTVNAHAADVFELDGLLHDIVHATPRQLRIIDEATLISQVRSDLAGVRQQAVRLERQQVELNRRADEDAGGRATEQARVTRGLEAQAAQLQNINERLQLNRLNEAALDELIRQADALVEQGRQSSQAAQENLKQAAASQAQQQSEAAAQSRQTAAEQQQDVQEKLKALSRLLDQGQDALGLKLELARLRTEQEALSADTRELMPRTIGQDTDSLPQDVREALEALAERQEALAEQAQEAIEKLQSTAESLARQGESDADRATAEALAEAAAVAQRQGLSQQMQQSQQGLEQNQVSQASQAQMQSLDTLEQMMQELGDQDQLKQELLRRRLLALEDKLKRLIEAQTLANQALQASVAEALPGLADGQSKLWVRTIAVQTEAEADEQTAVIGPIVGQAVDGQAAALAALRGSDRANAAAGQDVALERLEEALRKIQEQQEDNEQDQTQQQRRELREKYQALAERQTTLRSETEALLDEFPLTRRTRVALRGAGKTQATLREEAAALGEQVGDTIVFTQTHLLIDRAADRAGSPLTRGQGDVQVLLNQAKVATLLESMAAALDESGRQKEFAEGNNNAGGGGGSGSGGGQAQPLVLPAAELKLLRGVQQAVYDETRALGEVIRGGATPTQAEQLESLATEQRELSDVGQRLIESMQQQGPPDQLNSTVQPGPDATSPDEATPPGNEFGPHKLAPHPGTGR